MLHSKSYYSKLYLNSSTWGSNLLPTRRSLDPHLNTVVEYECVSDPGRGIVQICSSWLARHLQIGIGK